MPLTDLNFKPGIYSETTPRGAGKLGYWKDCNRIRFADGLPQKLGGWVKNPVISLEGAVRGTADWKRISTFETFIGFGTNIKLYLVSGSSQYDITPYRSTGALTNPFGTTNGSASVLVTHAGHTNLADDRVHFSGASAVGGITLDGEYVVTEVVSSSQYRVTHSAAATSTATGGGAVTYSYEIHVGRLDTVVGLGWGAGGWSVGTWSTPRTVTSFLAAARTWSLDTWGEDLIACPRDGGVYTWDASGGTSTRATLISGAPTTAKAIFVSQEDRHLVALGAHNGVDSDPLLIRWCDTEDFTAWTPTLTNTAGDKRLDLGNEIVCAAKVRGETLVFTDASVYSMVFSGGIEVFSFRTLGDCGALRGPNAVWVFEGIAYWMGEQNFFAYDGVIRALPCTVQQHVFGDFNETQKAKVWCGVNREFREVWWLYPSADSTEVDRYVVFSLQENTWVYGALDRTVLIGDSDVFEEAYGVSPDGYFYTHESGVDADGEAMGEFLASGDLEIDAGGNQLAHVSKFVPDFQTLTGDISVTLSGKKYPQATEAQTSGPHTVSSSTQFVNPRMRARQLSLRIESDAVGTNWRVGTIRVDLIPHGGR